MSIFEKISKTQSPKEYISRENVIAICKEVLIPEQDGHLLTDAQMNNLYTAVNSYCQRENVDVDNMVSMEKVHSFIVDTLSLKDEIAGIKPHSGVMSPQGTVETSEDLKNFSK